jgi:hypothetical protein
MPDKPRHPGIGRRLDQRIKCVRQKSQQTIQRGNKKIYSPRQLKQRPEPELQNIFLNANTNPYLGRTLRFSASGAGGGKLPATGSKNEGRNPGRMFRIPANVFLQLGQRTF